MRRGNVHFGGFAASFPWGLNHKIHHNYFVTLIQNQLSGQNHRVKQHGVTVETQPFSNGLIDACGFYLLHIVLCKGDLTVCKTSVVLIQGKCSA